MKTTPNFALTIYEPNDVTSYLSASGWNGTMEKIDSALESIQTAGATNATDIATLEAQTKTNEEDIETLTTDVSDLKTATNGNASNVSGLSTRVITLETKVQTLQEETGTEKRYNGVLSTGETTLAIEIGDFDNMSLVDVYSSIYGVNPLTIELREASSGQPNLCVTTWDEQSVDLNVSVKIDNMEVE